MVLTAADRAEIRDLAGRYSQALDLGDVSAWSEVFTVDGVMEMDAQGYDITGDALWSLPSGNVDRSGPQSRHIPTTFIIEGAGDDATMRSYVTVVGTGEGANIVFQGRYEDRLRRVDGRWRIAHRKIITDWIEPEVAKRVAAAP
jgi:ketosteroid isomerase-like protein